jgi:hypothetical protein
MIPALWLSLMLWRAEGPRFPVHIIAVMSRDSGALAQEVGARVPAHGIWHLIELDKGRPTGRTCFSFARSAAPPVFPGPSWSCEIFHGVVR